MNRDLWTVPLTSKRCQPWPCPSCGHGIITLVPDSFRFELTAQAKAIIDAEGNDPEYHQYIFNAIGKCADNTCGEQIGIIGSGFMDQFQDDNGDSEYDERFHPIACYPMPAMIRIPIECPKEITIPLWEAFSVFWSSKDACAGRIRVVVECLMNHLGVPKRTKTKSGKFPLLTLHARILHLGNRHSNESKLLMGLKILGNAGSHVMDPSDTKIREEDLLDAFDVLEDVLDELVGHRSKRIKALANKLAKRHS